MQKLADIVGIRLVGMKKDDGQFVTPEDDRVVFISKKVEYSSEDCPWLSEGSGNSFHRFRIADLFEFLEKRILEGRTHIEFKFSLEAPLRLEANCEELMSQQAFCERVKERDRVAKEEIVAKGLPPAEQEVLLRNVDENTERDLIFIERMLSL